MHLSATLALSAASVIAACGCTPAAVLDAFDTACNTSGCISVNAFSANIDDQLRGKVVGYVSIVGALPVTARYGQARTAVDPPGLAMDNNIPTNVASLSKVLTTIAVLKSLAIRNLTLDSKIAPYLPPDWSQGLNISTISFRELLTHRAGFRATVPSDHAGVKQQIADGVTPADKSVAQYNNLNFAIFRELLPYMEGFADPGPATRASATAAFYINYMRQHVFQPLGITGADCRPPASSNPMLSYPPPPVGAAHGTDWGDWTSYCGGGGWVLSAGNLWRVLVDLAGGNVLLTDAQKSEMNANCLGWDCSVQPQKDFVGKNGILPSGTTWLWTFFGIFKGRVPVVLVVNSNIPGNSNITDIVVNAFTNAAVPHP